MTDSMRAKKAMNKSVKDDLKWRLFAETVDHARQAFASLSAGELRDIIEEAVSSVRKRKIRNVCSRSRK